MRTEAPGKTWFERASDWVGAQAGRPWPFHAMCWGSLAWFALGPLVGWAGWWYNGYQVFTAWASFVLLFALQNRMNRGDKATHVKLDELIRSMPRADDRVIAVDDEAEDDLDRLKEAERAARECTERRLEERGPGADTGAGPTHPEDAR